MRNFGVGLAILTKFSFSLTGMAPLSGAERARRFREKNQNRIREEDALRKRHMRLSMKIKDPAKNEERLRKKREYKRNYRQKMKAAAALSESQQNTTSSSTSTSTAVEGFSQRSIYMRSLRKGEKALPKSPRKQKAVVTSLAKKFALKIAPQQNNRGGKRQELTEEEVE